MMRTIYGQIIARVSAPELVEGGYIIPPRIQAKKFFMHKKAGMISCETDAENVIDTIEETDTKKDSSLCQDFASTYQPDVSN